MGGFDPLAQLATDVAAIVTEVERLTGVQSRWSGKIGIGTELNAIGRPRYFGAKAWNCDIVVHQSRLLSPFRYSTIVHEAFHAVSSGLNQADYDAFVGFEEGVVEQCTRLFRAVIMANVGLPMPTDVRTSYDAEIVSLEMLRQRTRMTAHDFNLSLLKTPLPDREAVVIQWIGAVDKTKTPKQIERETATLRAGLKP